MKQATHTAPQASLRDRALAAGLSSECWYAVERSTAIRPGDVRRVEFWKSAIALYRGRNGTISAVEDRCAHRLLSLAECGRVEGETLACGYHGWRYDGTGRCVSVPYAGRGAAAPSGIGIRAYPTREKYGLVWLYPGDPARAERTPLPSVPRIDARPGEMSPIIDEWFDAHHSLVIENFCDLFHEHLHRRYQPFDGSSLAAIREEGDNLIISYETAFARGLALKAFLPGFKPRMTVSLHYEYPHLWLDFQGSYELRLFLLPVDPARTRVLGFFASQFLYPLTGRPMGRVVSRALGWLFKEIYSATFTSEDRRILRLEQQALSRHRAREGIEINPAVLSVRRLLVERWERGIAQAPPG